MYNLSAQANAYFTEAEVPGDFPGQFYGSVYVPLLYKLKT